MNEISVKTAVGLENLPEAKALREEIFVQEQGFQEEFDGIDPIALHMVLYVGEIPAATGRTFCKDDEAMVGRIAVKKEFRGKGLGLLVLKHLEEILKRQGKPSAALWAQTRAMEFYQKAGYAPTEETHYEEFCHHTKMVKKL